MEVKIYFTHLSKEDQPKDITDTNHVMDCFKKTKYADFPPNLPIPRIGETVIICPFLEEIPGTRAYKVKDVVYRLVEGIWTILIEIE